MTLIRKRVSTSLPLVLKFAKRSFNSLNLLEESLHGIHLFQCPDSVGFVAELLECIASRGGSILNVDVCVPENKSVFYSISEFIYNPAKWPREQINKDFHKLAMEFNAMRSVRVPDIDPKYKIAVLASKQDEKLPVDIACVIRNHDRDPNTHVIHFFQRNGIPYYYLPTTKEDKREERILDLVSNTDFVILARYMQVERVSHRDTLQSFVQKSENFKKQCLSRAIKSYCELQVLPYEGKKTVLF